MAKLTFYNKHNTVGAQVVQEISIKEYRDDDSYQTYTCKNPGENVHTLVPSTIKGAVYGDIKLTLKEGYSLASSYGFYNGEEYDEPFLILDSQQKVKHNLPADGGFWVDEDRILDFTVEKKAEPEKPQASKEDITSFVSSYDEQGRVTPNVEITWTLSCSSETQLGPLAWYIQKLKEDNTWEDAIRPGYEVVSSTQAQCYYAITEEGTYRAIVYPYGGDTPLAESKIIKVYKTSNLQLISYKQHTAYSSTYGSLSTASAKNAVSKISLYNKELNKTLSFNISNGAQVQCKAQIYRDEIEDYAWTLQVEFTAGYKCSLAGYYYETEENKVDPASKLRIINYTNGNVRYLTSYTIPKGILTFGEEIVIDYTIKDGTTSGDKFYLVSNGKRLVATDKNGKQYYLVATKSS